MQLSIETDFNLGYQAYHIGKPSDYQELADEYRTSINVKQWLKINWSFRDIVINSDIWELTWFEFRPLDLHTYYIQPESVSDLVDELKHGDIEA